MSSVRQSPQVQPSAFEIRFSKTEAQLEVFEIPSNNTSDRIPDPFKKRDKIPRGSINLEQYNVTTPPVIKQNKKHHGDNLSGPSSLKVKPSNSVGPEASLNATTTRLGNLNESNSIERKNSLDKKNALDDESIIKSSNNITKRQKSSTSQKSTMSKLNQKNIIHKDDENNNKLLPKDGGIFATPPDTPPRSPQMIPTPTTTNSNENDGIISTKQESQLITPSPSSGSTEFDDNTTTSKYQPSKISRKRKESQSSQSSQSSRLSTKRSIEINAYQPPRKFNNTPRSRRLSTASDIIVENPQENFTIPRKQQSQPIPTRSRIPRLSISSRERPIIDKKVSQSSLSSQGSITFNIDSKELSASYPGQRPHSLRLSTSRPIINASLVSDVAQVETEESQNHSQKSSHLPKIQSSKSSSSSPSSPPSSPTSPTSASLPSSPITTSHSLQQRKLIISHDDVIIPTIAKKLKMNGQLPFVNHDALLGYSEEPEDITPTTENGYMDITDQVVDLFDNPKNKSHKKQSTTLDSQRNRQRSNSGHSRSASKTHYVAPRKQNHQQPTQEKIPSPTSAQFENSSEHSSLYDNDKSKRTRSRREEYIMVIHDDDDNDDDNDVNDVPEYVEPQVPSEPFTAPTVPIETHDQIEEKIDEPVVVQIPVVQAEYNQNPYNPNPYNPNPYNPNPYNPNSYDPNPAEVVSAPTVTGGKKKKKDKKKKQKKGSGNLDNEEKYVRKSKCGCTIM